MANGLWVVLNVDNVDKSVEFYKLLGFKAGVEKQNDMTWGYVNASDDAGFIIWNKHSIGPNQDQADMRAWLSGEMGKGVVLSLGVPNAQKVWQKVQGKVTVDEPIYDEPWGGKTFMVVDPDGYVVSVSDKFPGASTAKKAKRAVKRTVAKAKRVVKGKGKAARKGR